MNHAPTDAERLFFDSQGYLILEGFLTPDHVARLNDALDRAIARRRTQQLAGEAHTGMTHIERDSTRIFYILDDDPLFLEMLDFPPILAYVHALLSTMPHHHASDAIDEIGLKGRGMGWHIDGHDDGFRNLGWPIPLLQLKVGYYLSDMTLPGQGNLCVAPGSHRARIAPSVDDQRLPHPFDGALEVCAPAGTAILFHNALWHSGGPWTRDDGRRRMLYYAYEHPWMVASQEHWSYPKDFYANLSPERRKLFHGFVFDPPEARWG